MFGALLLANFEVRDVRRLYGFGMKWELAEDGSVRVHQRTVIDSAGYALYG